MIRFLRRLFRREKGYRFPNGIPRVEVTSKPTGGKFTFGGNTYDYRGTLIEGGNPDLLSMPWVIFEDGDDK